MRILEHPRENVSTLASSARRDTARTPAPLLAQGPEDDAAPLSGLPASIDRDELLSVFQGLIDARLELALPARGRTLQRWRALAQIASCDVVLVKLYEAHADALAILADLDPGGSIRRQAASEALGEPGWGVWAAEPPNAGLEGRADDGGVLHLSGRKAWCSGAGQVSHALVTYRTAAGEAALAAVALGETGITVTGHGWHAVGMAATASVDVLFEDVRATPVGAPGAYLDRPGFWHGGAGIAACWYGAVLPLAGALREKMMARPDPYGLANLGRIDFQLRQTRALLRETAMAFDDAPAAPAMAWALRARNAVEACASDVMAACARSLGAGPLCRDDATARRYADLPVFLRQSHAERDLAAAGECSSREPEGEPAWRI